MHGTRASSSKKAVGPRCREALSQTQRLHGRVPNRSVARKLQISADSQARHDCISRGLRRAFAKPASSRAGYNRGRNLQTPLSRRLALVISVPNFLHAARLPTGEGPAESW